MQPNAPVVTNNFFCTTHPFPNFYKLKSSNLASEFACMGSEFHPGIKRLMGRRVLAQRQFLDGGEGPGSIARLSFLGCFEPWLSCEYQTLYYLDSGDLIYQNEVIHPTREDKPSFQRISWSHRGPCSPSYLQPVRECTVINLTGTREPPFCTSH